MDPFPASGLDLTSKDRDALGSLRCTLERSRSDTMRARLGLALTIISAIVVLVGAAPARADLNWSSESQQLSSGDQNSSGPSVAVDSQGGAVAVWTRFDGANDRVY